MRLIDSGQLNGFKRIDLFTDGGGKHFKNVYAMEMASHWEDMWQARWSDSAAVPMLWWNVMAPYHGHGTADSHAGSVSQTATRIMLDCEHEGKTAAVPATLSHK
jgi:hypothetical protein